MSKLVILISGKHYIGKSILANMIAVEYLNRKLKNSQYFLTQDLSRFSIIDTLNNDEVVNLDYPNIKSREVYDKHKLKIYSFLDPLRQICIDAFGLDEMQCYGSDRDTSTSTHILWEDLMSDIRKKYKRNYKNKKTLPTGLMTANEFLKIFHEDIMLKIDRNSIARNLFNTIENDNANVAIVNDCYSPSEVTMATEKGYKVIRLTKIPKKIKKNKECFDDDYLNNLPQGEFTLVVDNQKLNIRETFDKIKPKLVEWFNNYGVI